MSQLGNNLNNSNEFESTTLITDKHIILVILNLKRIGKKYNPIRGSSVKYKGAKILPTFWPKNPTNDC